MGGKYENVKKKEEEKLTKINVKKFSYLYEMIVTRMRIIDKKSEKKRKEKKAENLCFVIWKACVKVKVTAKVECM